MDARKPHLHALAERELFVELPAEIRRPGVCGRLRRCLYGTRDAPALWGKFVRKSLTEMGFTPGAASSCLYSHSQRDLALVVHGDDFTIAGAVADLEWVHEELGKRFLL